ARPPAQSRTPPARSDPARQAPAGARDETRAEGRRNPEGGLRAAIGWWSDEPRRGGRCGADAARGAEQYGEDGSTRRHEATEIARAITLFSVRSPLLRCSVCAILRGLRHLRWRHYCVSRGAPVASVPSAPRVSTTPRFSFCSSGAIFARSPTATTISFSGTTYFSAAALTSSAVTADIRAGSFV